MSDTDETPEPEGEPIPSHYTIDEPLEGASENAPSKDLLPRRRPSSWSPSGNGPSKGTVGCVAWGCLLPALLYSLFMTLMFSDTRPRWGLIAIGIATSVLLALGFIRLLRKPSTVMVVLGVLIALGFSLLLFGLCANSMNVH